MIRFALFKEVPKRRHRKKRKLNTGGAARKGSDDGEGSDDDSDGDEEEDEPAPERMSMPKQATPPHAPSGAPAVDDSEMEVDKGPSAADNGGGISPARYVSGNPLPCAANSRT